MISQRPSFGLSRKGRPELIPGGGLPGLLDFGSAGPSVEAFDVEWEGNDGQGSDDRRGEPRLLQGHIIEAKETGSPFRPDGNVRNDGFIPTRGGGPRDPGPGRGLKVDASR